MKRHLLIVLALLFTMSGFSQGIEFEHGSWKEVLAKAQQTNKPIFVDASAPWCGACVMMKKNILSLEEVGKVYNANYICYEVDVEKGDGIQIKKDYEVRPIPSFLFIRPDGSLFHRAIGYKDAEKILAESQKALALMNDSMPITIWDKEYVEKKNDPKFLLGYINKRSSLGMPNAKLFDEYLKLLPESERISSVTMKVYKTEEDNFTIHSFAFSYLLKNRAAFENVSAPDKIFIDYMLNQSIRNSLKIAIFKKDEQLLAEVIANYELLPKNINILSENGLYTPFYGKDEIYMEYYQGMKEKGKYLEHVISMGNNYLLKMTDDLIAQKDKANAQMLEEAIKSGQFDTTRIAAARLLDMRNFSKKSVRNAIGWRLNYNAGIIFDNVSDKQALQDAIKWSKRSFELSTNSLGWKNTYANLLYKSGMKTEAIAKQQELLGLINKVKNPKGYQEKVKLIQKMRAGEKIWGN